MNRDLNIAKELSTEVKVFLADAPEMNGRFFLADHAQNHYGEETLLDLLNNAEKQFIPFALGANSRVILISKAKILGLSPKFSNSDQWPRMDDPDEYSWPLAKVVCSEFSLEGRAYTGDMQPERRRLADLLNSSIEFFVFETKDGPWIFNKNLLHYLEPLV